MNQVGMSTTSIKMTDEDKIRLGIKKMPRGKLTVKVVYPVRVGAGAMFYQTEMIAKTEVEKWKEEHKGLVIL